mgnify:CR=1 FL=1
MIFTFALTINTREDVSMKIPQKVTFESARWMIYYVDKWPNYIKRNLKYQLEIWVIDLFL